MSIKSILKDSKIVGFSYANQDGEEKTILSEPKELCNNWLNKTIQLPDDNSNIYKVCVLDKGGTKRYINDINFGKFMKILLNMNDY